MTETPVEMAPVVPEGKHYLDLTIAELDYASRKLGRDLISSVSGKGEDSAYRMAAFAWFAFLWSRRSNPGVEISAFMQLTATDLLRVLRIRTGPAPAEAPAETPTDSSSGSSSPGPGDASPTTS